nr:MAG TPA: hypothetical protein [Caudoviricetes sp.]
MESSLLSTNFMSPLISFISPLISLTTHFICSLSCTDKTIAFSISTSL